MIDEKEKEIELLNGKKITVVLSKIPCISAREIISKYTFSSIPKIGEYEVNEEVMIKMMSYVQLLQENETKLPLVTKQIIEKNIPDWETLAKIEWAMIQYNCSFLAEGRVSSFLQDLAEKAPEWIIKMLNPLLRQLWNTAPQPGSN